MSRDVPMESKPEEPVINVDFYRKVMRKYLELGRYTTAQFWGEKIVTLSQDNPEDVYWLAYSFYIAREYHRAAHLLTNKDLFLKNPQCAHLAASCLEKAKDEKAVEIFTNACLLATEANVQSLNVTMALHDRAMENIVLLGNSLLSCNHLGRGRVFSMNENREMAAECFIEALKADVFCYEAFQSLFQHQMLTSTQEQELIASLPFAMHCPTETDQVIVRYLYENLLNKYRCPASLVSSAPSWLIAKLENSLDLKTAQAERHYYNCNFLQCCKLTVEVINKDPYHLGCLPIHISCLAEQKNTNELFLLAHRLVNIYPESAISWYAVGCYYYVLKKNEQARRFLDKATRLDRMFGPAWIAFGHAFASDTEHDQAMAAYFKASQLMAGCHLPVLYVGLENGLSHNTVLAEKFFLQAHEISPNDPFVLHEMGVIAFQAKNYEKAQKLLEEALEKIKVPDQTIIPDTWEPLLNNLGHVYRKLCLYDKALEYHMEAMRLRPLCHSTYSAIGYCQLLMGHHTEAINWFHMALSRKRDDTITTSLLNHAMDVMLQHNKDENAKEESVDVKDLILPPQEEKVTESCFLESRMDISRDVSKTLEDSFPSLPSDSSPAASFLDSSASRQYR